MCARTDGSLHRPPLASSLGDHAAAAPAAWGDDFLALGGRLRPIYGTQVAHDEVSPAYVVSASASTIEVSVVERPDRDSTVRMASRVIDVERATAAIWELAMRENARLRLARLSVRDGVLWADYELPFRAACGPILHAGIAAVGRAAARLRGELAVEAGTA